MGAAGVKEAAITTRPAITKGGGLTTTERYLARRAEQSFLNLWSYPNPYRDQGRKGGGDGKELCDLLVVCGRHVIIFSEKNITWPKGDVKMAWRRWAKRALLDSARQARGAERWIREFPHRIFLDSCCTQGFPIELPGKGDAEIHRVVVARGAGEACARHFGDGIGSLRVRPEIAGGQHCVPDGEPFAVGDLDPSGSYVHVMDDVTLDILLGELDTLIDFAEYLTKKAAFARSGHLRSAAGEQDLLARYAVRMNEAGDHDFVDEHERYTAPVVVEPGLYGRFTGDPRILARRRADEVSYFWDRLIESFTRHMIDGTTVVPEGHDYDVKKHEIGVRHMALRRRVERRGLGGAVAEALVRGAGEEMFRRAMVVPRGEPGCETGFFVFTMKYLDWMKGKGGYDCYRRVRINAALAYGKGLLLRMPHLERVIGIACEPAAQGQGGSEDLVYVEQAQWSDAERAAIEEDCGRLGMLRPGAEVQHRRYDEFPET